VVRAQVLAEFPIGKVKYEGVASGLYMASEKGTVPDNSNSIKLQSSYEDSR
jgi:hypothetical protein